MFIFYLNAVGATSINTLYLLHGPLAWNPGIIGVYQSISEFVHGIALIVLLSFLVIIGLPDALIVLLGMIWATALFTAQGLVRVTAQMFIGELLGLYVIHKYISHHFLILTAVGIVQGGEAIARPPLRSLMSKAVAVEDQGTCCFFCCCCFAQFFFFF